MHFFVWNLDFIARLACTLSIANTLSPAPTFMFAFKNKVKIESISSAYLTTGLIGSIIWLMYGSKKKDTSLILANGAALTLFLLYIFILYSLNSHWKRALPILYFSLFSLMVLAMLTSSYFLGQLGALLNILQTVVMASSLIPAIKLKDSKYINLTVTLFSGLVQAVWTVYGHLVKDNFIYVPSLFSLIIALIQLSVYMWAVDIFNPSAFPDSDTALLIFKQKAKSFFTSLVKTSERLISSSLQAIKNLRKRLKPTLLLMQASVSVRGEPKIQKLAQDEPTTQMSYQSIEQKIGAMNYGTIGDQEGTVFVTISENEPLSGEN